MSNDILNVPVLGCMLWGRGGNMLKTSVHSQQIFLYVFFVICNLANNEKMIHFTSLIDNVGLFIVAEFLRLV